MKQVLSNILFLCILGGVWGQRAIEISRRIMNGENAKIGQFPYHAILMLDGKFYCGASVIHKHWALTAAHCIGPQSVKLRSIVVGGIKRDGTDGKKYEVEFLVSHENYSSYTTDYDIMLLRLKTDIKFNKNISPIKLPVNDINQYENSTAVISGLGSTSLEREFPKTMQFANLRVLPQAECKQVLPNTDILDSHVCSHSEIQKAVCKGDSGGALVVNGTQIGLASFVVGQMCSAANPGVYTRISYFLPWIRQNLQKHNDKLPR